MNDDDARLESEPAALDGETTLIDDQPAPLDDAPFVSFEEQEASDPAPGAGKAQLFDWGAAGDGTPVAALPVVDRLNERLVRSLRELVEQFARQKAQVTATRTTVKSFGDWRAERAEFTSINLYALQPLAGAVLLAIEPNLISRLVDAFYGGAGVAPPTRAREFTAAEDRLLARFADGFMTKLAEFWSEPEPVEHRLIARETNIAHAALVAPDDPVVVATFEVALGQGRVTPIHVLYPATALRGVGPALRSSRAVGNAARNDGWLDRLSDALGDVRLEARSVLARPSITVGELMQLSPGDVIPISLPAQVPLLVAGRKLAYGQIGEQSGRAALMVDRIDG